MRLSRKLEKIDISSQLTSLNDYLHGNEKIIAVFLFGSYGTSFQTPLGDVDFGLLAAIKLSFEEQLNIQAKFSEVLREDLSRRLRVRLRARARARRKGKLPTLTSPWE